MPARHINPLQPETFHFMRRDRSSRAMHRIYAGLALVVGLAAGIIAVLAVLGVVSFGYLSVTCAGRAVVILSALGPFAALAIVSWVFVTTSDITLEARGIRLHLLEPWNVRIPWESFRDMRVMSIKVHRSLDSMRIKRAGFAVHVPGLPLPYRFVGLFYRLGLTPVFLITPDHEKHEALLARLEQIQQSLPRSLVVPTGDATTKQPETFHFMPQNRFARTVQRITAGVAFVVFSTIPVMAVLGIGSFGDLLRTWEGRMFVILAACFPFSAFMTASSMLVTTSDITLEARGIRLHLLEPWWNVRIPWEAFRDMRVTSIKVERSFGSTMKSRPGFAVHVPGLPFPYRLVGWHYHLFTPVFLITPNHERHEALLARLKEIQKSLPRSLVVPPGDVTTKQPETFHFMPQNRLSRTVHRIAAGLRFVILLGLGIIAILAVLDIGPFVDLLGTWKDRVVFIILAALFLSAAFATASLMLVTTSDITLEAEGIRLHLLEPWNVRIPWASFRDMRVMNIKVYRSLDSTQERRAGFAVHVPSLPLPYRLVGLRYCLLTPVFLITPDHERHEALLARLEEIQKSLV